MSTSLTYIEEGAVALSGHELRRALHLRRAGRDVKRLVEIARRLDLYLVGQVKNDAVGAGSLLLELRDALAAVGGDQ